MNYLLAIVLVVLLIGVCYVQIGRKTTPGEGVALLLAILAAFPLSDVARLLVREFDCWQDGQLVPGVILGKLSSSGADGSRTIGGRRHWRTSQRVPAVLTADGFRLDDVLARMMVAGSPDAWIVEYRYPCDSPRGCWQRESVSRALWSNLFIGQTVNVRTASGQINSGRLDENRPWSTIVAKLAIGGTLGIVAGVVSGRLRPRRRKFVTTPAVVTAVEPLTAGGKVHWRVRFAYFSDDGIARENADEVYVPGIEPGDNCTAVYSPDDPDLGTLRVTGRVSR